MISNIEGVSISSENAGRLAKFYQEKVGLKAPMEAVFGENDEELFVFEFKEGCQLYIMDNRNIKGQSKEHLRISFSLETDNIENEVKKLDGHRVKKIQDIFHMENYGYIAIFEDIDGNRFQIVQVR